MASHHKTKPQSNPLDFCDRHETEPVAIFSLKHEKCMCLQCAVAEHDQITDFVPVAKGGSLMRTRGHKLMKDISLLSSNVKATKRERINVYETMKESERSVRAAIKNLRQRVNHHLDQIEKNALKKINSYSEKFEKSFKADTVHMRNLDTDLRLMSERLGQILNSGSDVEVIKTVVDEKNLLPAKQEEAKGQDLAAAEKIITFEATNVITQLLNEVKTFGKVSLITKHKVEGSIVPTLLSVAPGNGSPVFRRPNTEQTTGIKRAGPVNLMRNVNGPGGRVGTPKTWR